MTTLAPAAPAGTAPAPGPGLKNRIRRNPAPYLLALAGAAWLIVLFVIPLISGLAVSLMTGNPQDGYTFTWNWAIYGQLFGPEATTNNWLFLGRAIYYGAAATILTILVAFPMAYFIAFRVKQHWKNALLLLVMLSFLVSFVIRTDMWAFLLSDQGPVLTVLRNLHLVSSSFHILGTNGAVIFGMAYNDLAFMVLPIYVALERIDPRLLEASADLYGRKSATFFHTVLPLTRSGIFAGILLVFIDSAGDPVSPSLLGGTHTYTIGQAIQDAYLTNQQYNVAAALSTVLMIVLGVILFAYARIAGTDNIEDLV
jgi:spermidine/putrescine transport system permease protein